MLLYLCGRNIFSMDPNAGKKGMFNKFNKQQALQNLEAEKFNRKTVSFYRYVIIPKPNELRDELYEQWNSLDVFGRIYLAKEGINAQLSVPTHNWKAFVSNVNSYTFFEGITFKTALEDNGRSFFKLTIKVRNQIVADGLRKDEYDVTNVGNHLSAKQWNNAMRKGAILVDMRNHYESEIGRFKGAICPQVETFQEELPEVKRLLKGKEEESILLYCTGGIRCEKASAYLKHNGFLDVNQLHGGIIDYARQLKEDKTLLNTFEGKNFVFDERLGERVSNKIISNCHQCGGPCDTHTNCKNVNCNLLFIQCEKCKKTNQGCCSPKCIKISQMTDEEQANLRAGITNKKRYHSHSKLDLSKAFKKNEKTN